MFVQTGSGFGVAGRRGESLRVFALAQRSSSSLFIIAVFRHEQGEPYGSVHHLFFYSLHLFIWFICLSHPVTMATKLHSEQHRYEAEVFIPGTHTLNGHALPSLHFFTFFFFFYSFFFFSVSPARVVWFLASFRLKEKLP